jgi:hypothetical protein
MEIRGFLRALRFLPVKYFDEFQSNLSKTIVELPNPSLQFSPRMAGRERTRSAKRGVRNWLLDFLNHSKGNPVPVEPTA